MTIEVTQTHEMEKSVVTNRKNIRIFKLVDPLMFPNRLSMTFRKCWKLPFKVFQEHGLFDIPKVMKTIF